MRGFGSLLWRLFPRRPGATTDRDKAAELNKQMDHGLKVGSYANVDEGCSIRYKLFGGGAASFVFGIPPHDDFELCIDTEALRELVKLGSEALAQLDAPGAQKQAEEDTENCNTATSMGELVTAGERSA